MMQYLLIEEGAFITIKSAFLQQGSYVKLQPHSTDFIELANPRAVCVSCFLNPQSKSVPNYIVIYDFSPF
jgi:ubiquitin fusion degradation protein 1